VTLLRRVSKDRFRPAVVPINQRCHIYVYQKLHVLYYGCCLFCLSLRNAVFIWTVHVTQHRMFYFECGATQFLYLFRLPSQSFKNTNELSSRSHKTIRDSTNSVFTQIFWYTSKKEKQKFVLCTRHIKINSKKCQACAGYSCIQLCSLSYHFRFLN
jgi:hypothetical protein